MLGLWIKKKFMRTDISKWANLKSCPLNSIDFVDKCRQKLSDAGVSLSETARMTFFGRLS